MLLVLFTQQRQLEMMSLFCKFNLGGFYAVCIHPFLKVTGEVLDFFQAQLITVFAETQLRNVDV